MRVADISYLRNTGNLPRVHGNGMLQLDLPDYKRLHVMGHPLLPRQRVATPWHNHRFGFRSEVIRGALINLVPLGGQPSHAMGFPGKMRMYDVYRARPMGGGEETELVRDPTYGKVHVPGPVAAVVQAGSRYEMPPGDWHCSIAAEPTVTIMQKTCIDEGVEPQVLCPVGQAPDNGFMREQPDVELLWEIIAESLAC